MKGSGRRRTARIGFTPARLTIRQTRDAEGTCSRGQLFVPIAVPDDEQAELGMRRARLRVRFDEVLEALDRDEPPDTCDDGVLRRKTETLSKALDDDGVGLERLNVRSVLNQLAQTSRTKCARALEQVATRRSNGCGATKRPARRTTDGVRALGDRHVGAM